MAVYITGDTHGDFRRIKNFCRAKKTTYKDTLIILGDSGINYHVDNLEYMNSVKYDLSKIPVTLFCIHGNHEQRAENMPNYEKRQWFNGPVLVEPMFRNIKFAIDGEVYKIPTLNGDKQALVCGGAYSVDKFYRIIRGYNWFDNEQPSNEIKAKVENKIAELKNKIDIVLTHTCPYDFRPVDMFLPSIDQSTVDSSTEIWLQKLIDDGLKYNNWYCGHYHVDRDVEKSFKFMFNKIIQL